MATKRVSIKPGTCSSPPPRRGSVPAGPGLSVTMTTATARVSGVAAGERGVEVERRARKPHNGAGGGREEGRSKPSHESHTHSAGNTSFCRRPGCISALGPSDESGDRRPLAGDSQRLVCSRQFIELRPRRCRERNLHKDRASDSPGAARIPAGSVDVPTYALPSTGIPTCPLARAPVPGCSSRLPRLGEQRIVLTRGSPRGDSVVLHCGQVPFEAAAQQG
jgi:hypothetical protein